jgi:hypothetical protein
VLNTYRTIKFDANTGAYKQQSRGPSIAEQYLSQADVLIKSKKHEQMLRNGLYVPKLSGIGGLVTVNRTEDEQFMKKLKEVKPQLE